MAELKRNGISVSENLSVVGFDDIDIARYYSTAITAVHQRTRELGEVVAEVLLDNWHGNKHDEKIKLVGVS